jgi:hypothetical protein
MQTVASRTDGFFKRQTGTDYDAEDARAVSNYLKQHPKSTRRETDGQNVESESQTWATYTVADLIKKSLRKPATSINTQTLSKPRFPADEVQSPTSAHTGSFKKVNRRADTDNDDSYHSGLPMDLSYHGKTGPADPDQELKSTLYS